MGYFVRIKNTFLSVYCLAISVAFWKIYKNNDVQKRLEQILNKICILYNFICTTHTRFYFINNMRALSINRDFVNTNKYGVGTTSHIERAGKRDGNLEMQFNDCTLHVLVYRYKRNPIRIRKTKEIFECKQRKNSHGGCCSKRRFKF